MAYVPVEKHSSASSASSAVFLEQRRGSTAEDAEDAEAQRDCKRATYYDPTAVRRRCHGRVARPPILSEARAYSRRALLASRGLSVTEHKEDQASRDLTLGYQRALRALRSFASLRCEFANVGEDWKAPSANAIAIQAHLTNLICSLRMSDLEQISKRQVIALRVNYQSERHTVEQATTLRPRPWRGPSAIVACGAGPTA